MNETTQNSDKKPKKRLYAVFNSKGGVGKTSIATQISVALTQYKYKVAFYDLDRQQTAKFYFSLVNEKYRPAWIFTSLDEQPPEDADIVLLDCPPNLDALPPKAFTLIAPTGASGFDIHSYRRVLDLEQQGYEVIKVLNNFSLSRNDDKELLATYPQSVVISQNSAIRTALSNGKTIWNSGHPTAPRAKKQFEMLMKAMATGVVETMDTEKVKKTLN